MSFSGIVRRDSATIMFKALGEIVDGKDVLVDPVPNYGRKPAFSWDAYLEVSDPDALAAEFGSRGVPLSVPIRDRGDGLRGIRGQRPRWLRAVFRAILEHEAPWVRPRVCRLTTSCSGP